MVVDVRVDICIVAIGICVIAVGIYIVAVGSCSLPAFIIQNDQIMGQAEFITDTKVRYRCMDSYRLRGPKNLECKCRGRNCRQQPKKTPKCIKDNDK